MSRHMKENIYDYDFDEQDVKKGLHRLAVGGLWEELGKKQLDFMIAQGLSRSDIFLDVGCGCLRGGIHFIQYLDSGNYYGFDINQSLLDAGYEVELKALSLQVKLPKCNLLANDHFDMSCWGVKFDYAMAFSLFTHLTLNSIYRCLIEVSRVLEKKGRFFATVFLVPDSWSIEEGFIQSKEITTYMDRDPYHYHLSDIALFAERAGFDVRQVEDFKHPRNQRMLEFRLK